MTAAATTTTLVATEPIIRARLAKASDKHYRHGVLGLRARPEWHGGGFEHHGTPVTVVGCPSVLSIWEAIEAGDANGWTVVLTSVADDELGDTVLAHLLDGRLITPDPWDALRDNFSAATIEPALYRAENDRAVAGGLLDVLSPAAYTPAPGGVLTRDHAMAALARDVLGIVKNPDTEIDTLAILEWSLAPLARTGLHRLRSVGGPELTAAVADWLTGRAGRLGAPLRALLGGDRVDDLVPLGVIAGLFRDEGESKAHWVFLHHLGLTDLPGEDLDAWYTAARGLVTGSGTNPQQQQATLSAAAAVVDKLGIADAAAASELLRHGLDARLAALADALPDNLPRIEECYTALRQHFLAATSPAADAFTGAVRLARWLAEPLTPVTGLAGLTEATEHYLRVDSWVDTALVKARRGADSPAAAAALRAVIDACVARRAAADRVFAAALADTEQPSVLTVENVLPDIVIPLARKVETLLIVVDALSLAAANALVVKLQHHGWTEISKGGTDRRCALAVLPTLTQRSRCSLLAGELREGSDAAERDGFLAQLRAAGLGPPAGVPDPIFHKKALDTKPAGASLAIDVHNAIADTTRQKLVAVVLNYVDDTLHHTDPGGTEWNLDTVTHLRALLDAAKAAGRAVVITSDHGHIIDYGTGAKADRDPVYGQRAHGDFARVDTEREVIVEGPRVLTDSQRVVLAVDETIRYGARNAGYHGGGTPAEAVVPVVTLIAGRVPDFATAVGPVEPGWWHARRSEPVTRAKPQQQPTLFDTPSTLPEAVIATAVFATQLRLAGRIVVKPAQIADLLRALLATGAHEITPAQAAVALEVATASVNGALMQTKRVLDVEGYQVLRVGVDFVGLDVAALKEQFGVAS